MSLTNRLAIIVLAMLVGLAIAVPSQADGCFKNRTYYGVTATYTPTYAPTTYAVPYQSYAQTYYTPKVVEVVTNPDYYYSLNAYYQTKLLADNIVGRLAELQLKAQQQQGNPPPNPQVLPQPQQAPQPGGVKPQDPNPMQPLPQEGGPAAFDYQEPQLQAVIQRSCARCHTDGKADGGLVLIRNGKLVPHTAELWNEAFIRVSVVGNDQTMPKGGKPLEDAETVLFRLAGLSVKAGRQVTLK